MGNAFVLFSIIARLFWSKDGTVIVLFEHNPKSAS